MLKIDLEFQKLLEPLTIEEYAQLEENILTDGCRNPIIIWNDIIVDGHNRYKICTENNIDFKTVEKEFADRDEVEDWIDRNQVGRRNLTPAQMSLIRGRIFKARKKKVGEHKGNQYSNLECPQNDTGRTSEVMAVEFGVSPATIERDGQFAEAVEKLKEIAPEIEEAIHNKKQVVKADIIKAAKAVDDGDTEKAAMILGKGTAEMNREDKRIANTDTDKLGNEIPEHLKEVFADRSIKNWLEAITQLNREIKANKGVARAYLYKQNVDPAITHIRKVFNGAMPYAVCPDCKGDGCSRCENTGFMNEVTYKIYSERNGK